MNLQDLKQKLVAVLGYGQEGKAVTAYLMKYGIKPVLFDQRPWENWDEIEKLEIRKLGLNFIFGPDCFKELAGFDVAFRSPGIKLKDSDLVQWIEPSPRPSPKGRGRLTITSQTKWFFEHCPCKIIGVTGTKGKGTTASLIYNILSENVAAATGRHKWKPVASATAAHPNIYLTGNIGKVQPLEILDNLAADDWVVYELSSFQLQDLDRSPHIGVVLMVTSEHLDYHRDQQEYIAAKSSITKFQNGDDFAVINADFENSMQIGKLGKGKKIYFSRKKQLEEGCFVKDGQIVLMIRGFGQGTSSGFKNPQAEDAPWGLQNKFQISVSDLQIKGTHNLENVCAAVSVAKILNVDDKIIRNAVTGFKGLEYRLEFAGEKQGIKFYNDSFSTTPETAIAAVKSFKEPLVVILGGSTKHADFSDLGRTITESKNVKCVILIGQEAAKIKHAIIEPLLASPLAKGRKTAVTPSFSRRSDEASAKLDKEGAGGVKILEGAKNMKEIFVQIKSIAVKGDVVLLSPACASFDMFSSYVDRGNQFKEAVKNF